MTKIIAIITAALSGLGALLLKIFGDSKRNEGRIEEQNEQRARESEAKERANEVLAEHRDPDDAVNRLRNRDF